MAKEEIKKQPLKKKHFEILLEDIQDKFQFLVDGHIVLNEKVDNMANELKATRDELIFLMKASIEKSEERLTKKIEDGDKAMMEHTDQKIEEVKDILRIHSDKLDTHEGRITLRVRQEVLHPWAACTSIYALS